MTTSRSQDGELNMIVVMGVTGAGKSYFINKLAGYSAAKIGDTLKPCTASCEAIPATIGNSKVLLIDTPGFDDSERTDSDILTEISRLLSFQYEAGVKLKGVIYLHRITDVRYAKTGVRTLNIFKRICGESALGNVLLVTTRWNEVDEALGADRERQLREEFWQFMLLKGSTMARFHGSQDSAKVLASILMAKNSTVLEIQHELVDEGKSLGQTAAGLLVSEDLEELKAQHERDLAQLRMLQQTLRDNDNKMRRKAEAEYAREQEKMRKAQEDEERLRRDIAAEVRAEIEQENSKKKKGSKLRKALPFIPSVMSVLGLFVHIPPGTFDFLTSWLSDSGIGETFTEFLNSF